MEIEIVHAGGLLKPWKFRTGRKLGVLIRSQTSIEIDHPIAYSELPVVAQSGAHAGTADAAWSSHILCCCGRSEKKKKVEGEVGIMTSLALCYYSRATKKWLLSWPRILGLSRP